VSFAGFSAGFRRLFCRVLQAFLPGFGMDKTQIQTIRNTMRVCAVCHFKVTGSSSLPLSEAVETQVKKPASALVLSFSKTELDGKNGIIAEIASMSATQHMPMAAAYCSVCRNCTWLCRDDADINEACLEFMHSWHSTKHMLASLALMHAGSRVIVG
jgi:hypothetical protein